MPFWNDVQGIFVHTVYRCVWRAHSQEAVDKACLSGFVIKRKLGLCPKHRKAPEHFALEKLQYPNKRTAYGDHHMHSETVNYLAAERLPESEVQLRLERLRGLLAKHNAASADNGKTIGGMLIFSRINIYYFTGTMGQGCLWIPLEGEPVLALRKGLERAHLESPLKNMVSYKSFKELPALFAEQGVPFAQSIAVEKNWLPWSLSESLLTALQGLELSPADRLIDHCRSIKTEWELTKLRLCGQRFYEAQVNRMPEIIRPGMNELDMAHKTWALMFELGHGGTLRMKAPDENIMLGLVSVGKSGNYPTYYNGPLGHMGEHPALPYMGNRGIVWKKGDILSADFCFCLEGYLTDRTQIYFAGKPSEIPASVLEAQDLCLKIEERTSGMLKAGAIPSEIYAASLKLAAASPSEACRNGYMGLGGGKVPFLGHGIGLQIDEFPPIAARFDEPIQNNMVIALEPKIGLPGHGMVGVEDTYEVSATGPVSLTGTRKTMDIICIY